MIPSIFNFRFFHFEDKKIYRIHLDLLYGGYFSLYFKTKKERDYYYDRMVNAMTKNNIIKV